MGNLPTRIVYGACGDSFVIFDDDLAGAVADEIASLDACTTLGQVRALVPTLEHVECPLLVDEDDWPDLPDDEPVDIRGFECWPPSPDHHAIDWLDEAVWSDLVEEAGAIEVDDMMEGQHIVLPLGREAQLVEVLRRHGACVRRDDALIARLSP